MKKAFVISGLALALSACSASFKDVDHAWCPPEEAQVEHVNIAADALFQFDKSAPSDLLEKGKRSLDELIARVTGDYVQIERIDLVGHTDRLGSEAYNQRLGLARAETVRAYLQSRGITVPITASSAGESQPVTTDCVGEKATPALTACLQPDRRVTVSITGIRKGNKTQK
ncbi:hypothetical protein CVP05_12495 [Conservatibacter flavescens]|uniref:OmpA-like domain-containing protein n=2 Tax=Conservatibacter flavescens TaxID=28161 RepID=A0A2M8RZC5_9PAST|nr:hypothetical protein CVP05_12495 [Conservatibacter flavescens]